MSFVLFWVVAGYIHPISNTMHASIWKSPDTNKKPASAGGLELVLASYDFILVEPLFRFLLLQPAVASYF